MALNPHLLGGVGIILSGAQVLSTPAYRDLTLERALGCDATIVTQHGWCARRCGVWVGIQRR